VYFQEIICFVVVNFPKGGGGHGGGGSRCTGCDCDGGLGKIAAIVFACVFGGIFLFLTIAFCWLFMKRKQKIRKCKDAHHILIPMTRTNMLSRGHKSYTNGWVCDDCGDRHVSTRMSDPFVRCEICHMDYCMTCKDKFQSYSIIAVDVEAMENAAM
jgi:hypothetical protein